MTEEINFFVQNVMNYRSAKIIMVANYFNIFTVIEKGCNTLEKLVRELETDTRATELLLNALVALKLLRKEEEVFHITPLSKKCLVEGSPCYMGNNLKFQEMLWEYWSKLKDVVKTGKPVLFLEDLLSEQHPGFINEYIKGMDDIAKGPAEAIFKVIDSSRVRKMLDVGGGPGTYSIAFAKANPNLKAVILDLPMVLKVTKKIIAETNVKNQIELIEGNYLDVNFGKDVYDLILLSHITHNEGTRGNRLLFNKTYNALGSGGIVVLHDFLIDESKTSPKFSALFSINMLVYTKEGRTYSFDEYKRWMEEQGFINIERIDIIPGLDNQTSVITGRKE